MKPTEVFSSKARLYAKYRWSYAPVAIRDVLALTGANSETTIADIGAGTGILTREFIGRVKHIYAIEPNPAMRILLGEALTKELNCTILGASAEATPLAAQTVDIITVAQAVHWFDPEQARKEFHRILKPGGWLMICRNYGNDPALGTALESIYPPETDTEAGMIGKRQPRSYFFGTGKFIRREYTNSHAVNWEVFLGGLLTASFAPDVGSPYYANFVAKAHRIFDEFSRQGLMEMRYVTEMYLGQIQ